MNCWEWEKRPTEKISAGEQNGERKAEIFQFV